MYQITQWIMTDLLAIHDPSVGYSCWVHVFCVLILEILPVILLLFTARSTRLFGAAIGQCLKNELFHLKNLIFLSPDCWNNSRKKKKQTQTRKNCTRANWVCYDGRELWVRPMTLDSLHFVNTWSKTRETFFKWGKVIQRHFEKLVMKHGWSWMDFFKK